MGFSIKRTFKDIGNSVSDAYKDWGKDTVAAVLPVMYFANGLTGQGAYRRSQGKSTTAGMMEGASPYQKGYVAIANPDEPEDPDLPPMPEMDPSAPDAQQRALRRRQRRAGQQGRGSTLLTGPLGIVDQGPGSGGKQLLGS